MGKKTCPAQNKRPDTAEAWILGCGIASLASAFYLIKHARISAVNVHILDIHESVEQVMREQGDFPSGYDQFAGCLPSPVGNPLQELLASVPSAKGQGWTVLDEIQLAQDKRINGHGGTHFVVQENRVLRNIPTKSLGLSFRHRLDLIRFILKKEKRLGRNQVKDFLPESFFHSTFWAIWFGFQPWHSAIEFRRALHQHIHDFSNLDIMTCLDITGYYQYESVFLPICRFLQNLGVDFQFGTKVTDIVIFSSNGCQTVSRLDVIQRGLELQIHLCRQDIVIMTVGSTISGSVTGTNSLPPVWQPIGTEGQLDQNWLLWLELDSRNGKFGNPYNFCTRLSESICESFTITTQDTAFFNYLNSLSRSSSRDGGFIYLRESPWRLNVCVPIQPVFPQQPDDVHVLWGFASFPRCKGKYVKKAMPKCSGAEILVELLGQLNVPSELHIRHTITIPRVMPRMSSFLLARSLHDRPDIIPRDTTNIGLVGQFVDIPQYSCVDPSYSVRSAQVAVSRLMGVDFQQVERRRYSSVVLLNLLFRK